MANPLAFTFENTSLTILGDTLNPLFIAQQICEILGFTNPWKAIKDHCDPDDVTKVEITDRLNRKQLVNCVNESGLYALIFGSKLPVAKKFKKWVCSEVLPAIRKQGAYMSEKLTYEQALKIVEERNALEVSQRVNSDQQYELKRAVCRKAYSLFGNRHYSNVWNKVKDHFRVPRYTHIPAARYEEAMQFIQGLTRADFPNIKVEELEDAQYVNQNANTNTNTNKVIPLPENIRFVTPCETFTISTLPYQEKEEPKALPAPATRGRPKKDPRYLTDGDIEALKNLVYYFDELFKPVIQWASKEALAQNHPKASQFYDAWLEPGILVWAIKAIIKRSQSQSL